MIMPWRLYNDLGDYIFTWLIGYSALLGPIAGIMICDYFFIRKMRLNSDALYDAKGEYGGLRVRTIAILIIAVLPNLPGFINAAFKTDMFPDFFNSIYSYAWFVGITIAFVLYGVFNLGERNRVYTSSM
jgi:NCS1 family nucleobase:cation symporter-1